MTLFVPPECRHQRCPRLRFARGERKASPSRPVAPASAHKLPDEAAVPLPVHHSAALWSELSAAASAPPPDGTTGGEKLFRRSGSEGNHAAARAPARGRWPQLALRRRQRAATRRAESLTDGEFQSSPEPAAKQN